MATRTLTVNLVGRSKNLERAFDRSSKSAGSMAAGIGKATRMAAKSMVGLGAVFVGGAFAAKQFVDVAVDVQESLSKNIVVFGDAADGVAAFADTAAEALGMSRRQALEATGTFGTLAAAMKIPERQAAEMSTTMTALAADMASFNNASPEETLLALQSGLRGEAEPLRRFGVLLDAATLKQEALRQGLIDNTKTALTPVQKALAAYSVILEQTKIQQGDFERTSDGLANVQRTLAARLENVKEKLGDQLMPLFEAAAAWMLDTGVPAIEGLVTSFGNLGDSEFLQGVSTNIGELWDGLSTRLGDIADSPKWDILAGAFESIPTWAGDALLDLDAIDWSDVGLDELLDVFGGIVSDLDVIMMQEVLPGIGRLGGEIGSEFTLWLGRSIGEAIPGIAADAAAAFDFFFATNFSDYFGEDASGWTADWMENTGLVKITEWGLSTGFGFLQGIGNAFKAPPSDFGTDPGTWAGENVDSGTPTFGMTPSERLEQDVINALFGPKPSPKRTGPIGDMMGPLGVSQQAAVDTVMGFISGLGPASSSRHATGNSIVVNMPPGSDGDDVVAALSRWSQVNGPLPAQLVSFG
jgi:hypothetical protein